MPQGRPPPARPLTPAPAAAASAAPAPTHHLGGYRLLRLLGRGGCTEVYEALDGQGARVALKTLRLPQDEGGLATEAFLREAHLGQRLIHPGIVRVLQAGRAGDYLFLALEYVHGHDLRRYTAQGQLLPLARLLDVGAQIAQALGAAHDLGVLHRDIKPGNVLVDEDSGAVKVSDFGLARLGEAFLSRTGVVAGTPAYMAPEQLAEGDVGPHSDLYALGVLLFELASGRLPYVAASLGALLQQVGRQRPPALCALRPELPPALSALVAQLLAPNRTERPHSAAAVALQLQALRPASAGPAPPTAAGPAGGPKSHR